MRTRHYLAGIVAVAVIAAVAWVSRSWWWPRASDGPIANSGQSDLPNDPRETFDTPFRNVRPQVKYVGDAVCAQCHEKIDQSYHHHPMGRSMDTVTKRDPDERLGAVDRNPFDAGGFRYEVDRRGEKVYHRETAIDEKIRAKVTLEVEVQYVVGSNRNGRSYLYERDGFLFESPITWYPRKGAWDLSPGFAANNVHFNRPVVADCLFCHANQVEPVAGTANRYEPPTFRGLTIGCERCHGPGELHVHERSAPGEVARPDFTIVNPRHLDADLRASICEQCHLETEQRVARRGRSLFDFRPGLPLRLFMSDFTRPDAEPSSNKFIGAVEEMLASGCYKAAPDRLSCTSCHDPHSTPSAETKLVFYRNRCMNCHADKGCSVPVAERKRRTAEDACTVCHMPRSDSDIPHTSVSDHRIPRRGKSAKIAEADVTRKGRITLEYFRSGLHSPPAGEIERDRGVALMELSERLPDRSARECADEALLLLDTAVHADPNDLAAAEARVKALWYQGADSFKEADVALRDILDRSPRRETTLYLAATLALRQQRANDARELARRAIEVNPWRSQYHYSLAAACAQAGDWTASRNAAQEALRLNPASLPARQLLVTVYERLNDQKEAKAERERVDALRRLLQAPPR